MGTEAKIPFCKPYLVELQPELSLDCVLEPQRQRSTTLSLPPVLFFSQEFLCLLSDFFSFLDFTNATFPIWTVASPASLLLMADEDNSFFYSEDVSHSCSFPDPNPRGAPFNVFPSIMVHRDTKKFKPSLRSNRRA